MKGAKDFHAQRINVVQIGLGTNSTFLQNIGGEDDEWKEDIHWVLKAVSETAPHLIIGVAIEPVAEHVQALERMVTHYLPRVALLQKAMGETDCESEVHMLPKESHDSMLEDIPWWQKKDLVWTLTYVLNMSSVGQKHPDMQRPIDSLWNEYGVNLKLHQKKVVRELFFCGCELLIVDTEGYGVKSLSSMIEFCQTREQESYEDAWPHVIQFETQGHSDKVEGNGAEWGIITQLIEHGYVLIHYSHYNTQLAYWSSLWFQRTD